MPADSAPDAAAASARVNDRHGKLAQLVHDRRGVLELGCGPAPRHPEAVTVDALDFDGVDVIGDIFDVLAAIPDGSVDAIHSYHFLEHIEPLQRIVRELARVLKSDGLLHAVVPHFSNPYYYSDYTHRQPFGLYSFSYLADDPILHRRVPRYQVDLGLVLADVTLGFKAARPFYVRYALRRMLGVIVNCSRWTQEWYEAGWTGVLSCYELDFKLRKR